VTFWKSPSLTSTRPTVSQIVEEDEDFFKVSFHHPATTAREHVELRPLMLIFDGRGRFSRVLKMEGAGHKVPHVFRFRQSIEEIWVETPSDIRQDALTIRIRKE
jgi:hypothetical protein